MIPIADHVWLALTVMVCLGVLVVSVTVVTRGIRFWKRDVVTEVPNAPPGIPLDLLQALGAVCANFEAQSIAVLAVTAGLVNQDQRIGHLVLAGMSAAHRVETFESLARFHLHQLGAGEEEIAKIGNVVKGLRASEDRRNSTLHSVWTLDEAGQASRMKIARPKGKELRIAHESLGHAELMAIADKIGDATLALLTLVETGPLRKLMPERIEFGAPPELS